MIHRESGQAVFVHQCELKPGGHALTQSWGAFYPALDVNSMPQIILPNGQNQFCHCGGDYKRVEPCPPGEHECHPIAGHVERSDDHTKNLIPTPDPDPDEAELGRLQTLYWQLQQKHLIDDLSRKIVSFKYDHEHEKVADQIVLQRAKIDLARTTRINE